MRFQLKNNELEYEVSIYDALPKKISDRNVQFYLYKGDIRWWNGNRLYCEHKKQKSTCPTCIPESKEKNKQYYKNNADKIKEREKEYRKNNADKIKERKKKWRKNNADKIKEYRKNNADKMKEWRKNNADKIKKSTKEYYKNNADKMKEYYNNNADKIKYKNMERYYNKRGYKPGDIQIKVYENNMIEYLACWNPLCKMILGKSIGSECTPKNTHLYPDVQMWGCSFLIVFECDENAHRGKSYDCDYARMNNIAISVGCPVWFIRWNPHGHEKIERLGETADRIMNTVGIVWKENKQFNVTYIGYSEKQLDRNVIRKDIAHNVEDIVL